MRSSARRACKHLAGERIELEKLDYQIANWNRAQAQNRMRQIIGQFHDEIELVLSTMTIWRWEQWMPMTR